MQFEASLRLKVESDVEAEERVQATNEVSFAEYVEIRLRDYGVVHKTEGSLKNDRQILRDYLIPAWGHLNLKCVFKRDVAGLQGKLSEERRLRAKTINNIIGLAHTIFNTALQWEYVRSNPCEGLPQIRVPEQDFSFWTFDERDKFLRWAKTNDAELYDIIATAVYTGMRRGEMEALKRDYIDLERRFIIVKRSRCSKTRKINEYTKGKKNRRVPMNELVFRIMQQRAFLPLDHFVL